MEIRRLIEIKGSEVVSASPRTSVREAAKLLSDKHIGCVIVADSDVKIEGLVSERDIVKSVADHGAEIIDAPVSKIMADDILVCDLDSSVEALIVDVTERRVRHLPVMDGDRLVGVVSVGDLLKLRLAEAEYGQISRLNGLFKKKGVRVLCGGG